MSATHTDIQELSLHLINEFTIYLKQSRICSLLLFQKYHKYSYIRITLRLPVRIIKYSYKNIISISYMKHRAFFERL